jgi:hypothetical protein
MPKEIYVLDINPEEIKKLRFLRQDYFIKDHLDSIELSDGGIDKLLAHVKKIDIDEQWAWYNTKEKRFHFIYPSDVQVRMCSPDAFKRATKDGEGQITKVAIIPIEFLQSKYDTQGKK